MLFKSLQSISLLLAVVFVTPTEGLFRVRLVGLYVNDADTNTLLDVMTNKTIVDIGKTPNVSIEATVRTMGNDGGTSVRFSVDGKLITESKGRKRPFVTKDWKPTVGPHTLVVQLYRFGVKRGTRVVGFTVVKSSTITPVQAPALFAPSLLAPSTPKAPVAPAPTTPVAPSPVPPVPVTVPVLPTPVAVPVPVPVPSVPFVVPVPVPAPAAVAPTMPAPTAAAPIMVAPVVVAPAAAPKAPSVSAPSAPTTSARE